MKSYRSRAFTAFKAVCDVCNIYSCYFCEIHFNDIDKEYLIFIYSSYGGFITSHFLSDLHDYLGKVGVSFDYIIKSVHPGCCIEITLYK